VNLVLRRVLIVLFVVMILFTIEVATEDSMLINLPTNEDVIATFKEKLEVEEGLLAEQRELERQLQEDEYNDLFDHNIKHTFEIEFSNAEWEGLVDDMYQYNLKYGTYKSNNYRRVNIKYIKDDEEYYIKDVGIRSKGNIFSRRLPIDSNEEPREIHYMLKFNETFDYSPISVKYQELKTREVFNLEQLLLKWNNQNDYSYTNEVYSYELFKEAGVILPKASYAEIVIKIDGEEKLRSLYNIFEHYDEEFIRRYFQEERKNEVGNLYKGSWSATLDPITEDYLVGVRQWERNIRPVYSKETNKLDKDYSQIIRFSEKINQSNPFEQLFYMEKYFNTESFMKAMALNVLLGNPDDYRGNGNNYYYYFDENDYMTYIPFDYDNSMGSGWTGEPAFIDYTVGNDIYTWGKFDWNPFGIPLWENLIKHEKYQIMYEDYLMEYIESGLFSEESYMELQESAYNLYGKDHFVVYDKDVYITNKIKEVTEDVEYYRSLR